LGSEQSCRVTQPVLYPRPPAREADPKAISGRARYSQARLAFHPYPQVIRWLCTTNRFGPPCAVTRTSPCPWVDRLASGPRPVTGRPVRTRFPYGSAEEPLSLATEHDSPAHTAKGTRPPGSTPKSGGSSRLPLHCERTVSRSISLPSRGSFHLSLTVLVHYRSAGSI
jgi:hypothetical protein